MIQNSLDGSLLVPDKVDALKDHVTSAKGLDHTSPDANKENVHNNASGEDTESDSEKNTSLKEDPLKMKSPFTALNQKKNKSLASSGSKSRGAMLLNLSR